MDEYGFPEHGDLQLAFYSVEKKAFIKEYYTTCDFADWLVVAIVDQNGLKFHSSRPRPLPAEILVEAFRKVGLIDE